MNADKLQDKYFRFFKSKKHAVIPSASLVPVNDATVLFNTAGMQPLVPYLQGTKHPQGTRLVNVQKCLRTVDFENIGDNTHHTFFQMLGNWSLGDYFKKEAIEWSFEFLTGKQWLNIPLSVLAVTVFEGDKVIPRDEESYSLWCGLGMPEKRIAFVGKDNFWIAGETGPCGPSTEMFYWTGEGKAPERFDPSDLRWVEIWNDVFMAFQKREDGSVVPLKQKNVDTGMGLERTLAVLNGKKSAYETDLFLPIIQVIETMSRKKYSQEQRAMRIIADHIRASVFILGDENAVLPSNVDRGYILRRLIRRAIRYGKMIGITAAFIGELAKVVIISYGALYPELEHHKEKIIDELCKEEQKFGKTLDNGLKEFEKMAARGNLSGEDAFLLFQSYGFPLEMTEELAQEKKVTVDVKTFYAEYEKHKALSRVGAEAKFKGGLADTSAIVIRMHTATHLLNEALRKVISTTIHQRGSKLTAEEVKKVEEEVNRIIKKDLPVIRKEMTKEQALKIGAEMEFGQKYPDKVSVYFVGDYSKEFCGGPHVTHTGEIGHFKILKEEACAAGVRRIKAVVE